MTAPLNVYGYWGQASDETLFVLVEPGSWDGNEYDDSIFFYMDDQPLEVGDVIADGFVVTAIE